MLDWLDRSVAIVAAHPDDETIGAGAQLANLRRPMMIHVTDGAPRSCGTSERRQEYARTRRRELAAALRAGGVEQVDRYEVGMVDQEASLDLAGLTDRLTQVFLDRRPEVVVTHPYEGGHPDHDAAAFGVHAAAKAMGREKIPIPLVLEFTSYHAGEGGKMRTGEFLPFEGCDETAIVLTQDARRRKQAMLDCFVTQCDVLRAFSVHYERFRIAPRYDFTAPPHSGRLFYEQFDWGMTGERWRDLAGKALRLPVR